MDIGSWHFMYDVWYVVKNQIVYVHKYLENQFIKGKSACTLYVHCTIAVFHVHSAIL